MKKCPFCAEEIQDEAIKCRYCAEWLSPKEKQSQDQEEREGKKEAEIKKQEDIKELSSESAEKMLLPTNWLMFWKNVKLPLSILGLIVWTFLYLSESSGDFEDVYFIFFINMIIAVFYALVLIGLHRKTLMGWRLNWFVIILEPVVYLLTEIPENSDQELVFSVLVLCCFIWVITNFIYFYKRKDLFS